MINSVLLGVTINYNKMCLFYFTNIKLIMDKLNFVVEYLNDITVFANDMS